jgi:hypothetical protein
MTLAANATDRSVRTTLTGLSEDKCQLRSSHQQPGSKNSLRVVARQFPLDSIVDAILYEGKEPAHRVGKSIDCAESLDSDYLKRSQAFAGRGYC